MHMAAQNAPHTRGQPRQPSARPSGVRLDRTPDAARCTAHESAPPPPARASPRAPPRPYCTPARPRTPYIHTSGDTAHAHVHVPHSARAVGIVRLAVALRRPMRRPRLPAWHPPPPPPELCVCKRGPHVVPGASRHVSIRRGLPPWTRCPHGSAVLRGVCNQARHLAKVFRVEEHL